MGGWKELLLLWCRGKPQPRRRSPALLAACQPQPTAVTLSPLSISDVRCRQELSVPLDHYTHRLGPLCREFPARWSTRKRPPFLKVGPRSPRPLWHQDPGGGPDPAVSAAPPGFPAHFCESAWAGDPPRKAPHPKLTLCDQPQEDDPGPDAHSH